MKISINLFFLFLTAVFIILFSSKASFLGKTVYGDGIYYYSWIRSAVIDGDVDFKNEYAILGGVQPESPLGKTGNVYPIGPALFWSPFFYSAHQFLRGDGYSFFYQFYIGFISCLYAVSGIIILYRLLCAYFSEEISFLSAWGIAFGTNLLFYGSLDPVNSHSVSFFVSSILLTLVLQQQSFFTIGLFAGLLALMRTQDGMFLLLAVPRTIQKLQEYTSFGSRVVGFVFNSFLLVVGFFIAFLPQFVVWNILYGTITTSPYLDAYHYFDFSNPHLVEVLLSANNGIFLWTPLVAVCLLGLWYRSRISKIFRGVCLFLFFAQVFLIGSWSFWWQGASFSGRMFVSMLPIFAIGLGTILQRYYSVTRMSIILVFSIINMGAILLYLITH